MRQELIIEIQQLNPWLQEPKQVISSSPDYQKPGDSEKLERAYDTFHRTRTRTYNPPREMRA